MRKFLSFCCVLGMLVCGNLKAETNGQETPSFSLEQCIESALENNKWRPASQLAVDIAKAQHKQAQHPRNSAIGQKVHPTPVKVMQIGAKNIGPPTASKRSGQHLGRHINIALMRYARQ